MPSFFFLSSFYRCNACVRTHVRSREIRLFVRIFCRTASDPYCSTKMYDKRKLFFFLLCSPAGLMSS